MNSGKSQVTSGRRGFLTAAASAGTWLMTQRPGAAAGFPEERTPQPERVTLPDFSRSYCHYVPRSTPIWVRIQIECRCEVSEPATGRSDEYFLSVRTQTGLRSEPPSDHIDPGYDFWMIFSKRHIFIKRVHTSSYNNNPTRIEASEFVTSGWHIQPCRVRPLRSGAEVCAALRAFLPVVARTEFASQDGSRVCAIEYPVKWADGNPDNTFRVETGPVVLLDPNRAMVGRSPEFDDFQWAYLDYRSLDRVRCFLERPTPILSGATYPASAGTPRRNPALTAKQVAQIEERLYGGWQQPIPTDGLRKLFQTDHYSAVKFLPAVTRMYALDQPCESAGK